MRPAVSRTVQAPLVKRKIAIDAHRQLPLVPAGLPNAGKVTPLTVDVPAGAWTDYTRGFDINQVTSSAIRSKNITCKYCLLMPDQTTIVQPLQIRVIAGFVKLPFIVPLHNVAGISGAYDGVATMQDPTDIGPQTAGSKFTEHAFDVVRDSLGTTSGFVNVNGNVSSETIKVISDRHYNMEPSAVSEEGGAYFPNIEFTMNWKTNNRMRLYPYVTGDDPDTYDGAALAPVNNPGLWVPFIATVIVSFEAMTKDADRPTLGMTWTHYWADA